MIGERGRHAILYGERGVGKSSLSQIIPFLLPRSVEHVRHIRIQAFPGDTFSAVARRVFHSIHFEADYGEGKRNYSAIEFIVEKLLLMIFFPRCVCSRKMSYQ